MVCAARLADEHEGGVLGFQLLELAGDHETARREVHVVLHLAEGEVVVPAALGDVELAAHEPVAGGGAEGLCGEIPLAAAGLALVDALRAVCGVTGAVRRRAEGQEGVLVLPHTQDEVPGRIAEVGTDLRANKAGLGLHERVDPVQAIDGLRVSAVAKAKHFLNKVHSEPPN